VHVRFEKFIWNISKFLCNISQKLEFVSTTDIHVWYEFGLLNCVEAEQRLLPVGKEPWRSGENAETIESN
jgi:hypothetical protein